MFQNSSLRDKETIIWKLKKVKALDPIIDDAVNRLAELEIIRYIRVTDDSIQASNELTGNKRKLPVTVPFHPSAVGIYLKYDFEYRVMQILELNSAVQGWGERLVRASVTSLPEDWEVALVFDWSNGFWDRMEQKFNHVRWLRL